MPVRASVSKFGVMISALFQLTSFQPEMITIVILGWSWLTFEIKPKRIHSINAMPLCLNQLFSCEIFKLFSGKLNTYLDHQPVWIWYEACQGSQNCWSQNPSRHGCFRLKVSEMCLISIQHTGVRFTKGNSAGFPKSRQVSKVARLISIITRWLWKVTGGSASVLKSRLLDFRSTQQHFVFI